MQHVRMQNSWKSKSMLLLLVIAWLLFPIVVTVALLMRLIEHVNVDIFTSLIFGILIPFWSIISHAAPVCSFLMLFSEPCYQLNAWMKCLIINIDELKEESDQSIIYECKQFFYKGK